jgi:hypothetical protein
MTQKQAFDATKREAARHFYHEIVVDRLEVARTIGFVTHYVVDSTESSGPVQARVTVCRSRTVTDEAVKQYLANLLHGLVSTQNIILNPLSRSDRTRQGQQPERFRGYTHKLKGMGSVLFPPTTYPERLATVAALLICVAVVLNVRPFSKAPVVGSAPYGADLRGSLSATEEPSGLPGHELAVHTQRSQTAVASHELPEPVSVLMRPPPFVVADLGSSAFEVGITREGGQGIDRRDAPAPKPEHIREDLSAAKPRVVGLWAPDTNACSARDFQVGVLPTLITSEGAWAGETFCIFITRKETQTGWTVVAKCAASRERWTSNIRLTVMGDRLTWTSKRGTQAYTRCKPDILMAHAR